MIFLKSKSDKFKRREFIMDILPLDIYDLNHHH